MQVLTNEVIEVVVSTSHPQVRVTGPDFKRDFFVFTKTNGQRCLRFSSTVAGEYLIHDEQEVKVKVKKNPAQNGLAAHGPVTLNENRQSFIHSDGTPFFWLADTWWYGLTDRTDFNDFRKIVDHRVKEGFTVSMIVVGPPPEAPTFSQEAKAGKHLPFTPSGSINHAYFDEIDHKIAYIVNAGLVPCLFGSWGPHLNAVGEVGMRQLWQEMVARYAAYPVIWCVTGEVDLPVIDQAARVIAVTQFIPDRVTHYLKGIFTSAKKPRLTEQLQSWERIGKWIKEHDPLGHPVLIHPHTACTSHEIFPDAKWLDIITVQTGHSEDRRAMLVQQPLTHSSQGVFINLEPWYEGIKGVFGATEQRFAFWMSMLAGASGFCYGADGLWNMRTADNFLGHWGATTWQNALFADGAVQLARAKAWMEKHGWQIFRPLVAALPTWHPNQPLLPLFGQPELGVVVGYFSQNNNTAEFIWQLSGTWQGEWLIAENLIPVATAHVGQLEPLTLPGKIKETDLVLVLYNTRDEVS